MLLLFTVLYIREITSMEYAEVVARKKDSLSAA